MKQYKSQRIFKYDWFTPIKEQMELCVPKDSKSILEIGSFEGLSTVFFCIHCPYARITCVDHFLGGEDQSFLDLDNLFERFTNNTSDFEDRITVMREPSSDALRRLDVGSFDVVFVDGSHLCWDVLGDLCGADRVLRKGGVLIADDYTWENHRSDCPKIAIDAFIGCNTTRYERILTGRIVALRKLC